MDQVDNGFTLLEVLIALVILSIVAVVVVRQVGDSQQQIADSVWQDVILYKGREIIIEKIKKGEEIASSGSLAPEYPHIEWQTKTKTISAEIPITLYQIEFKDKNQQPPRIFLFEYILP